MRRALTAAVATLAMTLAGFTAAIPGALALGGDLDASYGYNHGWTAGANTTQQARALYADANGDALEVVDGCINVFDPNGNYSTTVFGSGTTINLPTTSVQDQQGRVIVGGRDNNGQLTLQRITTSGADTTFGTNGSATMPSNVGWQYLPKIVAAPDGSLAIWSSDKIVRLHSDGSLDTTWNPTGTTPGIVDGTPTGVTSMAFTSTGQLVVSYTDYTDSQNHDPFLIRYAADGSPDVAFGVNGRAPGFGSQTSEALIYTSVLVAPDDSIYAAGSDLDAGQAILARYSSTGAIDSSWGNQGLQRDPVVSTQFGSVANGLSFGPGGTTLYANVSQFQPHLVRYHLDGTRDATLGANGMVDVPDPEGDSEGLAGYAVVSDGIIMMRKGTQVAYVSKIRTTGMAAPTALTATPTATGVHLAWTNPTTASFHDAEVRELAGDTAPTLSTGTIAADGSDATADVSIPAGTDASFIVFAKDYAGNYSDGLSITVHRSRLTSVASSTLTYGAARVITSKLTRSDATALAAQPVGVWTRRHGTSSWGRTATVTSTNTGVVSYSFKPSYSTDVQLRYAGAAAQFGSISNVPVVSVASSISSTWAKTSVVYGTSTKVTGTVGPNQHGQYVYLQRYYSSAWHTLAKVALSSSSTYAFAVKPTVKGYSEYRIYKPADGYRITSVSRATRVYAS